MLKKEIFNLHNLIMFNHQEKIVVDVVVMEFVILLMDYAHVILDGKVQHVLNKFLENAQIIAEEQAMEYAR